VRDADGENSVRVAVLDVPKQVKFVLGGVGSEVAGVAAKLGMSKPSLPSADDVKAFVEGVESGAISGVGF